MKTKLTDKELFQCLTEADARKSDNTIPIAARLNSLQTYNACLREAINRGHDYTTLKATAAA